MERVYKSNEIKFRILSISEKSVVHFVIEEAMEARF